MPVMEHLEELRRRILYSLLGLGLGVAAAFPMTGWLMDWLKEPLGRDVYFFAPAEAFWTSVKVSLVAGFVFSMPVLLYQLWRFLAPGLYRREKKYGLLFVFLSICFFAVGELFCGFVSLPFALSFLMDFGIDRGMQPMISVGQFVDFSLKFYLAFGLIFQLPLVLTLLARLGVLEAKTLAKHRKYALLANAIVAAILTPTSDIFNMMLMLVPLTLLFEVGILGARLFGSKSRWTFSKVPSGEATNESTKESGDAGTA